jgi:hypothetical protein
MGDDDTALFEDLNVLHHRRERHRQRFGEFADRGLAQYETVHDRSAGGVGKSMEDLGELFVKHMVEYMVAVDNGQAIA